MLRISRHVGIPLHIRPEKLDVHVVSFADGDTEAAVILDRMLHYSGGEGERTPHMYKILKTAARAGYNFDDALSEVLWWNNNKCSDPHAEEYVIQWAHRTWK
jgi:hypothetical protein